MRLLLITLLALLLVSVQAHAAHSKKRLVVAKRPAVAQAPAPAQVTPPAPRKALRALPTVERVDPRLSGPTRVDMDEREISGQTTRAGAIYLFERKESAPRSMLRKRTSFTDEIAQTIQ